MAAPGWPDETKDPLLGSLPSPLLELLVENGWNVAIRLEAAFDTEAEAEALVTGLQGHQEARNVRRAWAKALIRWQLLVRDSVRRVRSRIANVGVDTRVLALYEQQQAVRRVANSSIATQVLSMCNQIRWKTRRQAKLSVASGLNERRLVEQREKARWVEQVVKILTDAEAPIIQQAALTANPTLALAALAGRKRSRTLRSRVRTWRRVRLWLTMVLGVEFPRHVGDMVDYILDLGQCAKSFPLQVSIALAFFEKLGCFGTGIARSPLFVLNVESLTTSLHEEPGALSVKKAPLYSISMVMACELWVMSARPRYMRILGWVTLVKIWKCLRFDDMQGLSASRLALAVAGLRSILGRSKTTGAGKKTGEIPCFIHGKASFTGNNWLQEGFKLFRSQDLQTERDFFLPVPTEDLEGFGERMLDYSYSSALTRSLLLGLKVPIKIDGVWTESEDHLIAQPFHLFWTLHSERHFCPSISAVLKIQREARNYLGRWGINGPQQSSDYVLTSRQIILDTQGLILSAISTGSTYDEEDLYDQLREWMYKRDPLGDAEAQVERLRILKVGPRGHSLEQPWPYSTDYILVEADDNIPPIPIPADAFLVDQDRDAQDETAPFWASVGQRSGFRRLHRTGGCMVDRHSCKQWVSLTLEEGQQVKSDQACRRCWPDYGTPSDSSSDGGSSDDSGSSSESSSTDCGVAVEEILQGQAPI